MMKKPKRWSELTTAELAAATRAFDDPDFVPVPQRPSKRELAALHRTQRKAGDRFRIALALKKNSSNKPTTTPPTTASRFPPSSPTPCDN